MVALVNVSKGGVALVNDCRLHLYYLHRFLPKLLKPLPDFGPKIDTKQKSLFCKDSQKNLIVFQS